ncbi:YIP1 family protein [Bradyrhizobium sp. McL0615]|uniref:YIP1 family protein n=1 Tax=Bradyrhizobium sp. McL0615 TaxID=3415673 RepID=UPI003CF0AB78
MPDAFSKAIVRRTPPLLSVWLSPGKTIERLVAERPCHLVLLLAVLGGVAASTGALVASGVGGVLQDWRVCLACNLVGGVVGIANLHISAVVAAWLGRRMGGQASTAAVRAVFAWSMLPIVFGQLVVLAIVAGLLVGAANVPSRWLTLWLPIVSGIFILYSVILTLLMLSRVQRFGFLRTMVSYWPSSAAAGGIAGLRCRPACKRRRSHLTGVHPDASNRWLHIRPVVGHRRVAGAARGRAIRVPANNGELFVGRAATGGFARISCHGDPVPALQHAAQFDGSNAIHR